MKPMNVGKNRLNLIIPLMNRLEKKLENMMKNIMMMCMVVMKEKKKHTIRKK
jgi:hypothetical protein